MNTEYQNGDCVCSSNVWIFTMCLLIIDTLGTDYEDPMKAWIKEIWKFGLMWQTKYAAAVPKNLGVGVGHFREI